MTAQRQIRVLIADDHPIFREGLRRLLEAEREFVVVGEAKDGFEAVQSVEELQPDVLLLDLAMPRASGLTALRELAERRATVRTIMLTAAIEREETIEAFRLGARGVVLKESATEILYKCLRAVADGEYWVGHERVGDIVRALRATGGVERPAAQLTQRELQIVAAVVDGGTNKDIGRQFGLTEQTVKNHLSHVFDKIGVSNRLELALYALHHGLLRRVSAS